MEFMPQPCSGQDKAVMQRPDIEAPARTLVVTAHPDDVDFGAAGSVARWTGQGAEVCYCILTDGEAGGANCGIPITELPQIRRAEQTAAAAAVGVSSLHWLGYPDGGLVVSMALRRDIARVIRQVRPERVVCQSPERRWDRLFASHPDHLAAGEATVCAVYPDSGNAFAFPDLVAEGLKPHTARELWVMGGVGQRGADTWVDVTGTFEQKLTALRAHASQRIDHDGSLEARMRAWLAARARVAGWAEGRLAETFLRVAVTGPIM
jgi:LmbE family N-acetylglucosaminyl deacetylase